jgi:hypothetical protein
MPSFLRREIIPKERSVTVRVDEDEQQAIEEVVFRAHELTPQFTTYGERRPHQKRRSITYTFGSVAVAELAAVALLGRGYGLEKW